jgi:hypothetical protein
MAYRLLFPVLLIGALAGAADAQTTTAPAPNAQVPKDCPPGAGANAPAVGDNSDSTLSDKLASSKGVICPPAGVDPAMQQPPQSGGTLKVVPPPGSPGGDPTVQPK